MEGDSEKTKISYFHHWVDSEEMATIESRKNNKTLLKQEDYDKLEETQKEGKYSLDRKLLYTIQSHASCQVKSIVACRRMKVCQARFCEFWRVSCTHGENCEKMQISLH